MTGIRFMPPMLYMTGSGSIFATGRSFLANLSQLILKNRQNALVMSSNLPEKRFGAR
jgi:hypothetical protein